MCHILHSYNKAREKKLMKKILQYCTVLNREKKVYKWTCVVQIWGQSCDMI